jgi:hypothetical protein
VANREKTYLFDLGLILKHRALEARRQRDQSASGTADRECQNGRVIAFDEVISILQQQAEGFGIPLGDLRLEDIEPDRDLV